MTSRSMNLIEKVKTWYLQGAFLESAFDAFSLSLYSSGTCTFLSSLKAGPYCKPASASCWYSWTVSLNLDDVKFQVQAIYGLWVSVSTDLGTVADALWASIVLSGILCCNLAFHFISFRDNNKINVHQKQRQIYNSQSSLNHHLFVKTLKKGQ